MSGCLSDLISHRFIDLKGKFCEHAFPYEFYFQKVRLNAFEKLLLNNSDPCIFSKEKYFESKIITSKGFSTQIIP